MVTLLERRQVLFYLAAIALGVTVGLLVPAVAPALAVSINPVLAMLLFATFLGVPLIDLPGAFRDIRFLGTVLTVNFVLVPVLVFGLSRLVTGSEAVLIGVLLVLLTPCVDYVIVFTGLAGGARDRLLAAAPLLMLLQILLLPGYLFLFLGPEGAALIAIEPFVQAFVVLIALPLLAAGLVQGLARATRPRIRMAGRGIAAALSALMVPLLMLTLFVVIGAQIHGVSAELVVLAGVVPLYAGFLAIMLGVGLLASRVARLGVAATRAVVFSGATRNSLVVLPLAMALPPALSLTPLVVVTQTLVELLGMVIFVRLVPRLTRFDRVPSPPD
ncbi:MAG: bile acid:sodium symporter [Cryobacterium sp.]